MKMVVAVFASLAVLQASAPPSWPVSAESVAAFGRGIPAGGVAPPSHTPGLGDDAR